MLLLLPQQQQAPLNFFHPLHLLLVTFTRIKSSFQTDVHSGTKIVLRVAGCDGATHFSGSFHEGHHLDSHQVRHQGREIFIYT